MKEFTFINVHTHHKPLDPNEFVIRNAYMYGQKSTEPNYRLSVGVHPWFVSKFSWAQTEKKLQLLLAEPNVSAIGEVGLDKLRPEWDRQLYFFAGQFELAQAVHKPLIIHCVKAYSYLVPFLKKATIPCILHGYQGNSTQTQELLSIQNVYFSLGPAQLRNSVKMNEMLKLTDPGRLFLETDTFRKPIENVYDQVLPYLPLTASGLQKQILKNFEKVFENPDQFQL